MAILNANWVGILRISMSCTQAGDSAADNEVKNETYNQMKYK